MRLPSICDNLLADITSQFDIAAHQSIRDIHEFVLGLKEQAVLKILSPIVSDRDLQSIGSMEKMSHIGYQLELTVSEA